MLISPSLVLLLCIITAAVCQSEICSDEKVSECLEPIKGFDGEINEAVVIFLEEEEMREHCRLYELFSTCMDDVRPHCSTLQRAVYEGIDDSYHYLCDETFDEYLLYQECLSDTKLHEEGEVCNSTLSHKLDGLDSTESFSYKKDRICQYAQDYLDCVENAVASFCGQDAGKWQRGLDERSLRPLLAELRCPGIYADNWWEPGSDSGRSSFVSYIITAVLLLVLLLIVLAVVYMCRTYSRRKALAASRGRSVAPPAVGVPYYANGETSILPAGWSPQQGAGPLPEKEPPPYFTGPDDGGAMAGAGGVVNPAGSPISPPAYSDITGVPDKDRGGHGGGHGGYGGGRELGISNPSYESGAYRAESAGPYRAESAGPYRAESAGPYRAESLHSTNISIDGSAGRI